MLLLAAAHAAAQTPDQGDARALIRSVRVGAAIDIDGRLTEPAWADAQEITLGFEIAPGDNVPAPLETGCRVMHDAERLYVGCVARDPDPGRIRAYVTERDAIRGQDRIELTLVPFDDGRRGYRFAVTPLGLQSDAQILPNADAAGGEDLSWNAAWVSAGVLTPNGFAVELAIPFSELRFAEGRDAWGFRIERAWPRGTEVRLRTGPWDRSDACDLCQTAVLTGLGEVRPGGAVRIAPTLTAMREAGGASAGMRGDAGADVLWSPVPSVALGAAVNPDFSHLEADEVRLDANERFTLQIPERRPFFLEGADLFSTPLRVVFTRSIADPDAAVRMTAKRGATAAGLILARDAHTNVVLPGPQGSRRATLAAPSSIGILRVRRDVGRASSVGFLATSRTADGYANQVASLDALARPWPSLTARVQLVASTTADPDALETRGDGRFGGYGAYASVQHATRDWKVGITGFRRETNLRLDAGFEPQVGVTGLDIGVRREILAGRGAWYQRIALAVGGFDVTETDGPPFARGTWAGVEYDGPAELAIRAYVNAPQQVAVGDRLIDVPSLFATVSVRPLAALRVAIVQLVGRDVDHSTGERARILRMEPRMEARIGRRIDLSLAGSLRRLARDGALLLDERATEVRVLYGLTNRVSLRIVGQLESTARPADGVRTRQQLAQALFSWELEPQSVLRFGIAAAGGDAESTGTLAFLKLGYAWRF